MDPARYVELFLSESREHLAACARLLVTWEQNPTQREPVDGLFRSIHTIKGMAATLEYDQVAQLSHSIESMLDRVRRGQLAASSDLIDALLDAVDALEKAIEAAAANERSEVDLDAIVARLAVAPTGGTPAGPRPRRPRHAPAHPYAVAVRVDPGSPMRGARAILAVERARTLGAVSQLRPPTSQFERDGFSGEFTFQLLTDANADHVAHAIQSVGDIAAVSCEDQGEGRGGPSGQLVPKTDRGRGGRGRGRGRGHPQEGGAGAGAARPTTVRVDLGRLDALMNSVGELVVARNRLAALAASGDGPLAETVGKVGRLVSEIQAEVMLARLTPVEQIFDRFPRAVRDLARDLGKEVTLELEGRHIEIDRAILEEIGDPLIHLLRNAIDHGIESPDARAAAGKRPVGRLELIASSEHNSVTFRVRDDGRGIDRDAILRRAKQDGLVPDTMDVLPDDALLDVIGRAGFSTATAVTTVSGRGVGVNVVLTRVRELGGSVHIESEVGRGTTVTLHLPRTLVVVRALLAQAGEERYVIPVTYVAETLSVDRASRTELHGREAVVLRDDVIPTLRLRELVGLTGEQPPGPREPCVILEVGRRRAGLVVDALLGQEEIVVEPFDPPRGTPALFSGAAILADGVPSLILDATAVV